MNIPTILRAIALLLLGCGAAHAAPDNSPGQARLVQGTFDSAADEQSFQHALAKAFGGEVKISASDGAAGDRFGVSVALSGDTALVGAFFDDTPADFDAGSAYVFTRDGTTWSQQAKLTASDAAEGDQFGVSVALSGDTALVGAFFDDTPAGVNAGSAYVFTRSGSAWSQQAKLTPGDGEPGDYFGFSVTLSGDTALVGAPRDGTPADFDAGSAYVFTRSGTNWTQQAKLTAGDSAADDWFGYSVALSGDTALLGAFRDDTPAGVNAGSAYVFTRSGTNWTQQAKLTAGDGAVDAVDDWFGFSVALSGDTALVGAYRGDTPAVRDAGSAYVFTRSGAAWLQQAKLTAGDAAAGDIFGSSVALSGDTALVGAILDDTAAGVDAGSAYVFTRSGSVWSQQAKLTAGDSAAGDFFGRSVALSGGTALVGADFGDTPAGADAGSAYVYGASTPVPVIFIPGISGSTLVDDPFGAADEVWIGFPLASRRVLSLYEVNNPPPPDPNARDIQATDVVREVTLASVVVETIYRPLLDNLETVGGFREYGILGDPDRLTTAGCDLTQINPNPNLNPNLFVFPYDWRKSNVETAAKLEDYMGCVRLFHPDSEITLLTHSMGGLVARRYVLDNPFDHNIDKMITIAAPWLGAVKPLNVLETGDFTPHVASGPDMKYIAPSLTAASQLIASRAYFELGGPPMLVEEGYDADGDGQNREIYQYDDVVAFLDNKYVLPAPTLPGTTNNTFHSFTRPAGAQDDWRVDTTGVEYFHIYGEQAGNLTIAQLAAHSRVVCDFDLFCEVRDIFDLRFSVGDGTVPTRSAGRSTSFGNYNAPGAQLFKVEASSAGQNKFADHVGIAQNPLVLSKVLELLGVAPAPQPSALAPADTSISSQQIGGLPVTDDVRQSTIPSWYVTLNGGTPLVAADAQGNSTVIIANDLRDTVPGVQTHVLGDGVEMLTLPVPVTEQYSITFLSDGNPIALEVIKGVDNLTPTEAIRYLDTSLPNGVLAQIRILPAGIGPLRYDSDGNGTFDTLVPPTVTLTGPAALDATPPVVIANQNVQGAVTQVSLSASDSGSGVGALRYSLDGTQFQPYTGTLSINPANTPFVYAFADDNAGNRSSRVTIRVVTQATIGIFQNGFE